MLNDLNRLVSREAPENRLDPADTPPPIRSRTGLERKQAAEVQAEEVTAKSTDGLFTFVVMVVKT